MIEINEIDKLILKSIEKIDEEYYATIFSNITLIAPSLKNRNGTINEDDFYYYGERIFCYELYHQLRSRILKFNKKKSEHKTVKVQGEARKMNIIPLLEQFDLDPFETDKIPDIIIHNPSDSKNQLCVIEVKCKGGLTKKELLNDLKKLNDYCEKLQFKNAYFIAINTASNHINNLLTELNFENFNCKDKIKIICIEDPAKNPKIRLL